MNKENNTSLKSLRIVFMGTPEFAVSSLDILYNAGCNIVGVVTAPDKAAGRGMQLQQSAVKKYAVEKGLTVLQPDKLKAPEFTEALKKLNAHIQVVVAFRMLPEVVWNMPPMGTINVHGSLLPKYRGAAPINHAIINGEKFTGVTTFKLKHDIDTGNILLSEKIAIGENENAGELHDRMKTVGAELLLRTLEMISEGSIKEIPQDKSDGDIPHAPKLNTEFCKIDFNKPVDTVFNFIRGLSPYPAAYTFIGDKKLKIFSAEKQKESITVLPGTIDTDKRSYLRFACADGYLNVIELQMEGKKKLPVSDFLRGYRFTE